MSPLKSNSLTEQDLIAGCLQGQRLAQKALFEMYAGKMMAVCRRYTRTDQEAEDVLQDGFVKIFKHLDSFDFAGSFEGWIRRIFINTALKLISKKSYQNEQSGIDSMPDQSEDPTVFARLGEKELLNLIDSLPDGYRVVFNMFAIEGYSHKEIADMLHIKESTSRSQLLKARKLLQNKVKDLQRIAV
jgi:RNA polymerase sigma-70 factor (ECF subfamily)